MSVSKAIAQAWTDPQFKDKLLTDPHAALADHGVDVPEGISVNVVENTDDTVHLVLPVSPRHAGDDSGEELSAEEMEKVAGGIFPPTLTD